jgi:hypothetical protein
LTERKYRRRCSKLKCMRVFVTSPTQQNSSRNCSIYSQLLEIHIDDLASKASASLSTATWPVRSVTPPREQAEAAPSNGQSCLHCGLDTCRESGRRKVPLAGLQQPSRPPRRRVVPRLHTENYRRRHFELSPKSARTWPRPSASPSSSFRGEGTRDMLRKGIHVVLHVASGLTASRV